MVTGVQTCALPICARYSLLLELRYHVECELIKYAIVMVWVDSGRYHPRSERGLHQIKSFNVFSIFFATFDAKK